jgi:hypothetical protein
MRFTAFAIVTLIYPVAALILISTLFWSTRNQPNHEFKFSRRWPLIVHTLYTECTFLVSKSLGSLGSYNSLFSDGLIFNLYP